MRIKVASKFSSPAARLFAAVLLSSVATGCSSDVSRFGGLFSKTDDLTTNSIPYPTNQVNGKVPIPRGDVANASLQSGADLTTRNAALNQPFPEQASARPVYDNINTATISSARASATPTRIERSTLADPTASGSERQVALDQPMPGKKAKPIVAAEDIAKADPITTGTAKAGWSTNNAPSVVLRKGETIASLSKRYGVPEKEILKANGFKSASAAKPGQAILIPTFDVYGTKQTTAAKDAKPVGDDVASKKIPVPVKVPDQEQAVLPTKAGSRQKNGVADKTPEMASNDTKTEAGQSGLYEVQAGDSLAKISRKTGVDIDALKKANGLSDNNIRIGQKLKMPGAKGEAVVASKDPAPVADKLTTASVPAQKLASKTADAKPASYTPPVVAKESVSDAAKKSDVTEAAPEETGIGKYRWPVRGAVIAGYGANVDGNRNDGIDISVPEGTPIKSAENGVVIYSGNGLKELGNTVLVRHEDGTVTVYGHASKLDVARGQKVTRGQVLGQSGMSGNASRPQLHFEVRKDSTAVNPMTFLQ